MLSAMTEEGLFPHLPSARESELEMTRREKMRMAVDDCENNNKNKIIIERFTETLLTWHTNALRPPALSTRHPREMFHHPPSASCAPSRPRSILHSFAQWQRRMRGEEKGGGGLLLMLLTSEDEAGDPFFSPSRNEIVGAHTRGRHVHWRFWGWALRRVWGWSGAAPSKPGYYSVSHSRGAGFKRGLRRSLCRQSFRSTSLQFLT